MGLGSSEGGTPDDSEGFFSRFGGDELPAYEEEEVSLSNPDGGLDLARPDDGYADHCGVCGRGLEYGGRGKHPSYCRVNIEGVDHNPKTAGKGTRASAGGSTKGLDAKLKRVSADLAENISLVGAMASMALPVTGAVIMMDAEKTANGIVGLAKGNPKMLAALMKANQIGPGVAVGRALLVVGVAVMVDTQRIEPKSQVSTLLGVAAIWEKINGEQREPVAVPVPPRASFV